MRRARIHCRNAFTLIELMTVIAISAILLVLIIAPVIQAFNLTRTAQGFAEGQERARRVIELVSREIANSAGVLDNSGIRGTLAAVVPGRTTGSKESVLLEYVKLDIVQPAEGEPIRGIGGGLINPRTGREDPTMHAPIGQMVLPVTPGDTIIRYFIGLRNPFDSRGYFNPFDGLLMRAEPERDNLYVLYRAEAQPYVWDPTAVGGPRYVVNTQLFEVDPNTTDPGDPYIGAPILNDPWFFFIDRDRFGNLLPMGGPAQLLKAQRVQRWTDRATIITEVNRYDMIQPVFDRQLRQAVYDGNVPRIIPLIQFRPSAFGSEPAEAMAAVRLSEESDNMAAFAPETFRTKFGGWSSYVIRTYPGWPLPWDRNNPAQNDYLIGRPDTALPDWMIYLFDPDVNANEMTDGIPIFDRTVYEHAVSNNFSYPFSRALVTANLGTQAVRDSFAAYQVFPSTGKVLASFGIEEVGDTTAAPPIGGNAPRGNTGAALSPIQVPNPPGTIFDPQYSPSNTAYEINSAFNKQWEQRPELRPNIHRFIDLRVMRQVDGTPSPLHPDPLLGLKRTHIVPGSEVVIGPDQSPGPNYGSPVRYERTTRVPGPNQYRINYTDLKEPTDYTLLGFSSGEVGAFQALGGVYTPNNYLSSFIQPRYKAGYIQLHSDANVPLPETGGTAPGFGNIKVTYRFQFSRPGDSYTVDYDSRNLMSILLTIRNYSGGQTVVNPQTIAVKGTANARNILR